VRYFETAYLKACSVMGESSPSVESMSRGMAEVRELSRFSDSPLPHNRDRCQALWGLNACNGLISSVVPPYFAFTYSQKKNATRNIVPQ